MYRNKAMERAWAAGFFDGEGSVKLHYNKYQGNRGRPQLWLSINQCSAIPLTRFRRAVGVGKVYGPYNLTYKGNRRPYWQFQATRSADVELVLNYIGRGLSTPKRQQIREKRKEKA